MHVVCVSLFVQSVSLYGKRVVFLFNAQIVYDRVAYHSERYLLPVGFCSSRTYPSMLSPSRRTTYHCTILDGGDAPIVSIHAVFVGVRCIATLTLPPLSLRCVQKMILRTLSKQLPPLPVRVLYSKPSIRLGMDSARCVCLG